MSWMYQYVDLLLETRDTSDTCIMLERPIVGLRGFTHRVE
jgi:hypothetical protein